MKRSVSVPDQVLKTFEKVPDLYLILSPGLTILTASDAYLATTSMARDDILNRHLSEIIHTNFTQYYRKLLVSLHQVLITKRPHRMALLHYPIAPASAGNEPINGRYWRVINTPVLDELGEISYMIHKVEECPDQKEDITESPHSHQIIRLVLESSHAGFGHWDLQKGIIRWDEKAKAIMGFTSETEARTAEGWLNRIHPEDRSKVMAYVQECLAEAKNFRMEYRVVHASGEIHHILGTGYFQKDITGKPTESNGMVQDITHLRQAERALKESKDLLQAVFDTFTTHIAVFSSVRNEAGEIIDFTYRLANPGLEKFAGRSLVGLRYGELYPGAKTSGILDKLKQVVETGEPVDLEQYYQGEGISGWFRIMAIKLGDGLVTGMEDITRRKQAEAEKVINYQIHRQAEEVAHMGSWECDLDTGELRWSEGMYRLFGLKPGREVKPEIYLDYVVEEDKPVAEKIIRQIWDKPVPFEENLRVKVGNKILTLKIKSTPVKNGQGKIKKTVGVDLDITAIRKAETQLRENQQLLQAVFNVSPVGIVVLKAIRNKKKQLVDFTFELVNQQARFQGNKENLMGKRLLEEYPHLEAIGLFGRYREVVETGEPLHLKLRYPLPQSEKWFSLAAVKLDDGLVIISEDITRRKHMEEEYLELRLKGQQQLLHAILDAQEEERRRISESLHNGVGQILYATKLNLELAGQLIPQLSGTAQEAFQTTEKLLLEAIEETRSVSHELVPILLKDFGLEQALDDLCSKYSQGSLSIHCQLEGIPGRLDSHLEVALYRISQELVNNLVKHSAATEARLLLKKQGKRILLEVEDNGKGFSYQAGKMNGIGLRAIEDRVKLLNGTFSITRPKKGEGTLVTVRVPAQV